MTRFILLLIAIATSVNIHAQDDTEKITDAIVQEGKKLYRSEMASWYGTDLFMSQLKYRHEEGGGYFSYANGDSTTCIFYARGDSSAVVATIIFDSTFNVNTASINGAKRPFTPTEYDLYTIRKAASAVIEEDTSLFKHYKNTQLNLIPFIDGDQKKVFVLTGTSKTGVVILGNDYLLTFDKANKLISKKALHRNIISVAYEKSGDIETFGAIHNHQPETGDFITSTDICTLMLYSRFAHWKQHYVISANYVSIWNCLSNELFTMTRAAWDKIYAKQKDSKD